MKWPQVVMMIEFLLWFGGMIHTTITDRKLSLMGSVIFFWVMTVIIIGNACVLSAGGFW